MSIYKKYQDNKYIWHQLKPQDIPDKDLPFILHLNELVRYHDVVNMAMTRVFCGMRVMPWIA